MYNYDTILGVKRQGIIFNAETNQWEYYSSDPFTRDGEPQPEFVSESFDKCLTYKVSTERT